MLTLTEIWVSPRFDPELVNAKVSRLYRPLTQTVVSHWTVNVPSASAARSSPTELPGLQGEYTPNQSVPTGARTRTGVTPLTVAPPVGVTDSTDVGGDGGGGSGGGGGGVALTLMVFTVELARPLRLVTVNRIELVAGRVERLVEPCCRFRGACCHLRARPTRRPARYRSRASGRTPMPIHRTSFSSRGQGWRVRTYTVL